MGYKPRKKIYNITYEDYPGLTIKAVSASLGKLFEISNLRIEIIEDDEEKRMYVFNQFARRVIEWNLLHPEIEDAYPGIDACPRCGLAEDSPVPVAGSQLLCFDLDFIIKIVMGWIEATGRVAVPKELSLNNGENDSQEDSMMRLAQLANPVTLPMPN